MVEVKKIAEFVEMVFSKKTKEAIKFLNDLVEKGEDLEVFGKTLIEYLRKILILKITGSSFNPLFSGLTKEEFDNLKKQSEKIGESEIKKALELFLEAQNKIKYSPIPQLPLELAIVEFTKSLSD